jgi:hypothetical protein
VSAKSSFKTCLLSLVVIGVCFVVGRFWGSTDSTEPGPRRLTVKVAPQDVAIVGVGNSAYIDLAQSTRHGRILIEGWAVLRGSHPTLFIRSSSAIKISSAYLYPRADVSGFPGAIGFGLILENSRDLVGGVCLLTRANRQFHQIGGSRC